MEKRIDAREWVMIAVMMHNNSSSSLAKGTALL